MACARACSVLSPTPGDASCVLCSDVETNRSMGYLATWVHANAALTWTWQQMLPRLPGVPERVKPTCVRRGGADLPLRQVLHGHGLGCLLGHRHGLYKTLCHSPKSTPGRLRSAPGKRCFAPTCQGSFQETRRTSNAELAILAGVVLKPAGSLRIDSLTTEESVRWSRGAATPCKAVSMMSVS